MYNLYLKLQDKQVRNGVRKKRESEIRK